MKLDFSTFERSRRPNNYFVAPTGFTSTSEPDAMAPIFNCSPDVLFEQIFSMIESRTDWKLRESDAKQGQVSFVAVSKWMRFKDDIDILVQPVDGAAEKSTLAAYSRSRVGHSDLGVNRKRITGLLAALDMP